MTTTLADTALATGTMRAAVFVGPGDPRITTRKAPSIADPGEVLIAVEACGVCGTDLHILEDPPGHPARRGTVMGHELVGRVVETGSEARGVTVGDRVVVQPNLPCGTCRACKRGLLSHCSNFESVGIFRDGGLADLLTVPDRACHPISASLPPLVAVLAEPLSCVLNGIDQARPRPGEVSVIFGAGAIGLLFEAILRAAGVRCVVVEPDEVRRRTAARMGATRAVDPGTDRTTEVVDEVTEGLGADIVVDAVGSQLPTAVDVAAPRARVLLFGMNASARADVRQYDITRRELTVFGTYVGDYTFPDAIRILERGVADLGPVVSHRLSLEELPDGIEAIRAGKAVKVVVDLVGDGAEE